MLPVAPGLVLIPTDQEVFEKVAQELKSDILEGKCRAVEQFEQVDVLLLVERNGRCNVLGAERGITSVDNILQVGGGNLRRRDVAGKYLVCEVLERQILPLGRPVIRKVRDLFWNEKTAVGGKTLEYNFLEGELRSSV